MNKSIFLIFSFLIRFVGLCTIGWNLYDSNPIRIISSLPKESSFKLPALKYISDFAINQLQTILNVFDKIQSLPFIISFIFIFMTLIITYLQITNNNISIGLFPRILVSLGTGLSFSSIWYQFGPHKSEVILDFKSLFKIIKDSNLEEKREIFIKTYKENFLTTFDQKYKLSHVDKNSLLENNLNKTLSYLDDNYFALFTSTELKLKASNIGNLDAINTISDIVSDLLCKKNTELINIISKTSSSWNLPWGNILATIALILIGTVSIIAIYKFFKMDNEAGFAHLKAQIDSSLEKTAAVQDDLAKFREQSFQKFVSLEAEGHSVLQQLQALNLKPIQLLLASSTKSIYRFGKIEIDIVSLKDRIEDILKLIDEHKRSLFNTEVFSEKTVSVLRTYAAEIKELKSQVAELL